MGAKRASTVDSRLKGFDRFVRRCMKDWDVPGVAVGIVKGNRMVYAKRYGLRDVKRKLPVTKKTRFPIASCTKAFTATAVGILVDEGKLEWDKPVRDYLPSFEMYDPVATERVTPRDLLVHRTGMAGHGPLKRNSSVTRAELVRRLQFLEPGAEFRHKFQYNSLMYAAAGFLIEPVTGKTWEQFVAERIFTPLGMISSKFLIDDLSIDEIPVGYMKKGEKLIPALSVFRKKIDLATATGRACGPSGSIVSNVEDMCRWACFQMNRGKAGSHQVISERTLKEIHTPQIPLPGWESKCKLLLDASYCMGWVVRSYRGYRLFLHGGNGWGFNAHVMFLPNERIGAVVLTNILDSPLNYVIPLNIFDRLLGLDQFSWNARAKRAVKKQKSQAKKRNVDRERKRGTHPSYPLKEYAGDYWHPGYGRLSVFVERDKLIFRYDYLSLLFQHCHDDVFQMTKLRGDGWIARKRATFNMDKAGKIESVTMPFSDTALHINTTFRRIAVDSGSNLKR